jgi:hypothetical protein
MARIYSKWPYNIPTFSIPRSSKLYPNFGIFGMKIYHLATLGSSRDEDWMNAISKTSFCFEKRYLWKENCWYWLPFKVGNRVTRWGEFYALWVIVYFGQFFEKSRSRPNFGSTFLLGKSCVSMTKKEFGNILGDCFTNSSGHLGREMDSFGQSPGWPDEFVKKITQNVAQPIFCQTLCTTVTVEYSCLKIWVTSVIFK